MTWAYYNENDPKAAAWLQELIYEAQITPGIIDRRSIEDVLPSDLKGFTRCHFFAGVGGWDYALQLAGWPDDRPVWTGSCPCQPFSTAGKGGGVADERHLWPSWFHLIGECYPDVVFGEQVEAAVNHGWLDLVQTDLEGIDYAFAPVGLPAACVGAPHIRQRLWWVADFDGGDTRAGGTPRSWEYGQFTCDSSARRYPRKFAAQATGHGNPIITASGLGDANSQQFEGRGKIEAAAGWRRLTNASRWNNVEWIACRDGKLRPVEPGTFPLAHGVPSRVGLLRGYGNAIVPQVAEEVIRAYLSISGGSIICNSDKKDPTLPQVMTPPST